MTALASLSIAARATLDMHSLNNEGGEGNQIQTRMVDIVGPDGRMYNVNAISGDMFKHIQSEHFFALARDGKLPLCAGCQRFDANRINADAAWLGKHANTSDRDMMEDLLRTCAVDDASGILITAGKRSLPRKSVVEFGWVVGIPTQVASDAYFHVKYASERDQSTRETDAKARQDAGSNLGQAIFHRPASSGVYAIVCHLELGRIGYNEISQTYAIDQQERQRRARALIQSVLHTFVEINGAMRTTQLPHLVGLEGAITSSSHGAIPAPLISPLIGGSQDPRAYRSQLGQIAQALAPAGEVQMGEFGNLAEFAVAMRQFVDTAEPAQLTAR